LNRRHFLQAAAALPLASSTAGVSHGPRARSSAAFDRSIVRQSARDAASKPFKAPDTKLPDSLKNLDHDHYRAIRFLPEHAHWRGDKLPFEVQFFHRGFYYAPRVDFYEVANGQATRIAYRSDYFSFGSTAPPSPEVDLGFASAAGAAIERPLLELRSDPRLSDAHLMNLPRDRSRIRGQTHISQLRAPKLKMPKPSTRRWAI
jgi:glucan biosynthesis protein